MNSKNRKNVGRLELEDLHASTAKWRINNEWKGATEKGKTKSDLKIHEITERKYEKREDEQMVERKSKCYMNFQRPVKIH